MQLLDVDSRRGLDINVDSYDDSSTRMVIIFSLY
jgi:hypothetical protein